MDCDPAPLDAARLARPFYDRPAREVARDLLGAFLVHAAPGCPQVVRIVETEAYVGRLDLASHASRGRTPRNAVMFGPPGHAYVYFVYGMHHMLNVVTSAEGEPQAVLLRAAEPVLHVDADTSGPGKLARALGITRAHNGEDLCGAQLFFAAGDPPRRIRTAPRIGVQYAGGWAHEPLRFFDAESRWVSRR